MKCKQPSLLLHPIFLISLATLLLNDFYLKYEFHNWLTGKLSDFTGLFVFSIFLAVFFSKKKLAFLLFTGLFFIWWKSPVSNPFISFINNQLGIAIHRVVDYWDYLALSILPLAVRIKPINYPASLTRSVVIGSVGVICFFAFTATSLPRRLADNNKVLLDKSVRTRKTEKEIVRILEKNTLSPKRDTAFYEREWNDRYYLRSTKKSGELVMTPLDSISSGLYRKIDYGSLYTIPKMYVAGDSIYNLQLIINEWSRRKSEIGSRKCDFWALLRRSLFVLYFLQECKNPLGNRKSQGFWSLAFCVNYVVSEIPRI